MSQNTLPNSIPRADRPWWKGATIYQIYPRSFADSNGDGIGDLPGIVAHLDYVASLGVDAIWLSPFFTSPMRDFGYDVADYCDVDPIFGTLADFDAIVEKAHALGLKVIIDQVYAHTSDENAWFIESRSSRDNPKADWYVWADPKPEGSPPSNWQSVFGGPAWTWDARRGQYYLHNFLSSQPQLNGHNPEVQDALLASARFWLDRGADGFRVDAINFAMHDPALRDNPPAPEKNAPRTRPFDYQLQIYNQSHADIPQFLERLRSTMDAYGDSFTVAEVGGDNAAEEMQQFTQGDHRLNSAYSFDFLYAENLTPAVVADALSHWNGETGEGWPSWAFENHDAPRAVSRWVDPVHRDAFARMKIMLLTCLRGNIFLYYGEELGLTQVDIPFEQLQDPEAIANWPLTLSRDGARTPMPWNSDAADFGFGSEKSWLPKGEDHAALAVNVQDKDPQSLLNITRRLITHRQSSDALLIGDIKIEKVDGPLLALSRNSEHQSLTCVFNMGATAVNWAPEQPDRWRVAESVNDAAIGKLPPYGAMIIEKIA